MAREYVFEVKVRLMDDDQTDPDDLAGMVAEVLNCKRGACADWQQEYDEMEPKYRGEWTVKWPHE